MGYIKEPAGIDFVVDPTPLTAADRKKISEIIAYYKATGKKNATAKINDKNPFDKYQQKKGTGIIQLTANLATNPMPLIWGLFCYTVGRRIPDR